MVRILKPIKLRDIWKKETRDFTNWIYENIDTLGDVLNLDLKPLKKEQIRLKIKGITPLLMEKMDMSVVEAYNK